MKVLNIRGLHIPSRLTGCGNHACFYHQDGALYYDGKKWKRGGSLIGDRDYLYVSEAQQRIWDENKEIEEAVKAQEEAKKLSAMQASQNRRC